MGRIEWLRAAGLSYKDLEKRGYGFVVVEALLRYKRAAYFDDELTLQAELKDLGRASFHFEYEVLCSGVTLATGHTRHGCIDLASGRPCRIPKDFEPRLDKRPENILRPSDGKGRSIPIQGL